MNPSSRRHGAKMEANRRAARATLRVVIPERPPMLCPLLALALLACGPELEPVASSAQDEARAVPAFDQEHAQLSRVLAEHVRADRVDYAALKEDREPLRRYLATLEAVTPDQVGGWTERQRFAFWLNVYNAYTLDLVLDHFPLDSIKDIGGLLRSVWDKRFIPLEGFDPGKKGRKLSLNDVEHEILRKQFEDARLHAAVNCASKSCPPLRAEAFVAERLDDQLDAQVRGWLADPTRNRFDPKREELKLSKIFDWFAEDFERDAGSVQAWVARYAPAADAAWIGEPAVRVRYLDYDWSLNDVERR